MRISAVDRIGEGEINEWGILRVLGLVPVAVIALMAFAAAPCLRCLKDPRGQSTAREVYRVRHIPHFKKQKPFRNRCFQHLAFPRALDAFPFAVDSAVPDSSSRITAAASRAKQKCGASVCLVTQLKLAHRSVNSFELLACSHSAGPAVESSDPNSKADGNRPQGGGEKRVRDPFQYERLRWRLKVATRTAFSCPG